MSVKIDKVPFEQALDMTGFSKFNYQSLLIGCIIMMGMTFETLSVSYLVPASACELNTTSAQQGLMAGMPIIGIILTSHIWGYLADIKGRKKILVIEMVGGFVFGAAAAFSPYWNIFCLLKFLSSSFISGTMALSITLLSECTPKAQRNTFVILITTSYMTCLGILAVVAIPILRFSYSYPIPLLGIEFNGWRTLALVFSIPCAISALALLCVYESPKFLLSTGNHSESLEILRRIFVINTGKDSDFYMVSSVVLEDELTHQRVKGMWSSIKAQTIPIVKPPLLKNTILLSVMFICAYFCFHPVLVWLPFIANGFMEALELGADGLTFCDMMRLSQNSTQSQVKTSCALDETAMMLVFACGIILTMISVFNSSVVNYFGRKRLFLCIQFLSATAGFCINMSTNWVLTVVLFIIYISACPNYTSLSTFSVDMFPTYVKAMAVSVTLMSGRGSAFLAVSLMKHFLDYDCETCFYFFSSFVILGGIIGFLLPGDTKTTENAENVSNSIE